jgi:hypothetical protein
MTNLTTTVSGPTFYYPTSEEVAITSQLHLVSRYRCDTGGLVVDANVAQATATSQRSGERYSFTGADELSTPIDPCRGLPPNPIRTTVFFQLAPGGLPPSSILPPNPIRVVVGLTLTFDGAGQLTGASAAFGQSGDGQTV